MKIASVAAPLPQEAVLVLPVTEDGFAPPRWLDDAAIALCRRDMALTRFSGRWGDNLDVSLPPDGTLARLILVGAGKSADLTLPLLARLGGGIAMQLARLNVTSAMVAVDGLATGGAIEALATGIRLKAAPAYSLRSWSARAAPSIEAIALVQGDRAGVSADASLERAEIIADAVALARRLVNAPPNRMTPTMLIDEAAALRALGLHVETFVGDAVLGETFPGLVAVGRGSAEESGVAVLHWCGAAADAPAVALSAKGVTFDSGGLTPKSEAGQRLMKTDMAGAACAIATMPAIAKLRLPLNVVAAIGAVENLSGPQAYRSGDVLTMANGTTVEISFPDAEGRIVMADLNSYLAKTHDPGCLINLSTLTYAAVSAVGEGHMALFANDDALAHALREAGQEIGEQFWRLPTGKQYADLLASDIADFKNMVAPGLWGAPAGSASAAAEFLRHFAGDRPWASLDIVGAVWKTHSHELGPAGATGEPVRTLIRWLQTMQQ